VCVVNYKEHWVLEEPSRYKWKYWVRLLSRELQYSVCIKILDGWREYSGKWKEVSEETLALSFSSILLNRRLILSSPNFALNWNPNCD
jgi:hypothetical protein